MRAGDRWAALAALVLGITAAMWVLGNAAGHDPVRRVVRMEPVPMPHIPLPPQPRMPDRLVWPAPMCSVRDEQQCRREGEEFCRKQGSEIEGHTFRPVSDGQPCVFLCENRQVGTCEIDWPQPKPWPKPRGA